MITKDFVKDIELYICEKFGYRNSGLTWSNSSRSMPRSTVSITSASRMTYEEITVC